MIDNATIILSTIVHITPHSASLHVGLKSDVPSGLLTA
ncbi:hypothetical protein Barb6XT_01919 [Bacteroidales bacterium Barb6XT]|nr:hypothetical protein Barb6XT_01919 [Bacteroidales bacterium Barb6XT]